MFDRTSTFGETLDSPAGRAVLDRLLPGVSASPMAVQYRGARLGQLMGFVPELETEEAQQQLWDALAEVSDGRDARAPYAPAITPRTDYDSAPAGSAAVHLPGVVAQWGVVEVRFDGPSHGNPFVDVELTASVTSASRSFTIGGFYDGEGVYVVRWLAEISGDYIFTTSSTAQSLDGITGAVTVSGPAASHGPVRVDGFHFRYADGERYRPWGTTAYVWNYQSLELQQRTLAALATSAFTKMRMCLFPKSYLYNANEPARFPFPGSLADGFDHTRFDPQFFRELEANIVALGEMGIEADLILFHAYDRWGFADLGPAVDERVLRYVVRRLSAFANVWWSMANEYDLMWSKSGADWERLAAIVSSEDPHGHLNSIHNCRPFYDYSKPWITHSSMQRQDVYRTAEFTDEWRERWGKPVVIDECAYEGDIDQGWGNITGEEMTRRFWEGAVRGGYVGHGETYLNDEEELWWSKGGDLIGSSPARIGFLASLVEAAPDGVWDPLPSDWDVPWGGVAGKYLVAYFGFNRPRFRNIVLPPEGEWVIDVIDTWNMTIDRVPGIHTGAARVDLPGRQYMAIRVTPA